LVQGSQLIILTSKQLIEEIRGVLSRQKFKKYIKTADVNEVIAIHIKLCRMIEINEARNWLSDKKDNFLLNLYDQGNATILVSGDKELLREATELNYHILSFKEFELLFR
jgi:putative PIN family toxin of toxin-antitoxin system